MNVCISIWAMFLLMGIMSSCATTQEGDVQVKDQGNMQAMHEEDDHDPNHPEHEEGEPAVFEQFAYLSGLVGDWIAKGEKETTLSYAMTASNTVLVEKMSPGKESEMISMYHIDGLKLSMVHYCTAGNQPKMIATNTFKNSTIELTCDGHVSHTTSHNDGHMHRLVIIFKDNDHIVQKWYFARDGKEEEPIVIDAVRQKK